MDAALPPRTPSVIAMCITYPARVVGLDQADAIVDHDGQPRRASLLLRSDIAIGDWVLIGAGSILRRIEASEAAELNTILQAARASTRPSTPPGGLR